MHNCKAGPIKGLFDAANPPVTLKAALAAMETYLGDDLAGEYYTSGQHAKTSEVQAAIAAIPGMSDELARAIYLYTVESALYHKLNGALRDKDRAVLRTVFFPYLRLLITALDCLPVNHRLL